MKILHIALKRIIPATALGLLLGACTHYPPPDFVSSPPCYVQVGTATYHEVWDIKSALSKAGIWNFAEGYYPEPYRILVPAADQQRATEILTGTTSYK